MSLIHFAILAAVIDSAAIKSAATLSDPLGSLGWYWDEECGKLMSMLVAIWMLIGIIIAGGPTFSIALIGHLDKKIDKLDTRIDKLDAKIDTVDTNLRSEIKEVETNLRKEIQDESRTLRSDITHLAEAVGRIEGKLDEHLRTHGALAS